jgi:hypothetical protein
VQKNHQLVEIISYSKYSAADGQHFAAEKLADIRLACQDSAASSFGKLLTQANVML